MVQGSVSVIMPAYNEAHHIIANLRETVETLSAISREFEVIVVDDGSKDRTWLEAVKLPLNGHGKLRVIRYDKNHGKGNALMCGVWYATGDYIVFLDADMDLHPAQLPNFFQIMEEENADIVIGSKMHRQSKVNYPLRRRLYSRGYYGLVRLLFGLPVHDTQTGLKLFKAAALRRVLPKIVVKRFAFDLEVLVVAHHLGSVIREAPIELVFRRAFGRVKMRDAFNILRDTLAIYYRLRLLRFYDNGERGWSMTEPHVEMLVGSQDNDNERVWSMSSMAEPRVGMVVASQDR